MPKLFRLIVAMAALVGFAVPSVAWASSKAKPKANPHATYALALKASHCRAEFVKRTERHKVDGKMRRYIACVYVAPAKPQPVVATTPVSTTAAVPASVTAPSGNTGSATPTPTTLPPIIPVRASIDPDYTQSPTNPKDVTFSYSAGVTDGTLPAGTLNLTVFVHATVAASGGCTINVGDSVTSGACEVTVPAFGQYDLLTSYSGGADVSATSATEVVDIEPPAPAPETVIETWGSDSVTAPSAATDQVVGSQATVTVTSPNWEGATSTGITDSNGNTCTASISGHVASCTMSVASAPVSLTVNYPGGTNQVSTQTVSPWGVPQPQTVTKEWPSESVVVSGSTLTVSDQTATVNWANWSITGQGSGQSTPPNPINITSSKRVNLYVTTTGNVVPDGSLCDFGLTGVNLDEQEPCGYITYTVTQTAGAPTTWSASDEELVNSPNCSASQNYSGQGEGGCSFTFGGTGTFQISAEFISQDSNYSDTVVPTVITVNVS